MIMGEPSSVHVLFCSGMPSVITGPNWQVAAAGGGGGTGVSGSPGNDYRYFHLPCSLAPAGAHHCTGMCQGNEGGGGQSGPR